MSPSLLIIGAGPAGLLAALAAARKKHTSGILVVDHKSVAGAKLAVSGGGRGNISHTATETQFANSFGRFGRFTIPAFRELPVEALCALLSDIGVPTITDETGRIYPRSQSAAQVRDALVAACQRAGVQFKFEHSVKTLTPPSTPDAPWRADSISAHAIVLATGGQSAPRLGSDGSGFALARHLGYDIVPPGPALTSLHTREKWPAIHSGLSLPEASLSFSEKPRETIRGEVLFTHRGISGPAVLNFSEKVSRRLLTQSSVPLHLTLLSDAPDFQNLRRTAGPRSIVTWLAQQMPRALAATVLELARMAPTQTFAQFSAEHEAELMRHLMALPLTICGTGGFADSMLTAGGVSLKQVCPETLEGRLTPRLYFAGEVLDLSAPTGGWNLHWAFCSGFLAGQGRNIG